MNTQRYLLYHHGLEVEKMQLDISAVDWYESRTIQKDYPKSPSKSIEVEMWTLEETEKFIKDKIKKLQTYENTSDDLLPACSDVDKWKKQPVYAVKKKGAARATKLHSVQLDAVIHAKQIGGYVEIREAEDTKCISYCDVCTKCSYWKEKYAK